MQFDEFATATQAATFGFRKNRQGEWVICGPADLLAIAAKSGWEVPVTKKNGETVTREITKVGKPFGDGLAYGTPAAEDKTARRTYRPRYATAKPRTFECEECGDRVTRGTQCWETGLIH